MITRELLTQMEKLLDSMREDIRRYGPSPEDYIEAAVQACIEASHAGGVLIPHGAWDLDYGAIAKEAVVIAERNAKG